jgi:hypothetical protein
VPVVISLLITFCGLRNNDPCHFRGIIPDYLFFKPPDFNKEEKLLTEEVRNHCLLQKMAYMQEPRINCAKKTQLDAQCTIPAYTTVILKKNPGFEICRRHQN